MAPKLFLICAALLPLSAGVAIGQQAPAPAPAPSVPLVQPGAPGQPSTTLTGPTVGTASVHGRVGMLLDVTHLADQSFWDAMEASRKTVTHHWWSVFGLLLLGIPFAILGLVCLGVGILVAMPLIMGALAYAYEDLFNPGP